MFKSILVKLPLMALICVGMPLAQAEMKKVAIQDLALVGEKGVIVADNGDRDHGRGRHGDHHNSHHGDHHNSHHGDHHHGIHFFTGAKSGSTKGMPAPQLKTQE